jgi:hypothetical protein
MPSTIEIGIKLGPYEILSPLGEGGMGEVYRARDTRLNREVAVKVLPRAFAEDTNRMARFEREAQLLASLNHPRIAAIYGLEESGATRALVMELVEGPTLADRIAGNRRRRGPRRRRLRRRRRRAEWEVGRRRARGVAPADARTRTPFRSMKRCRLRSRLPRRWSTRMSTAWYIAI